MRIASVSAWSRCNSSKYCSGQYKNSGKIGALNNNNVNFNGTMGKVIGGSLGLGIGGLLAIAAITTPVGWIATGALLAAEAGGAAIGGAIGNKIEGKDDDD